MRYTTTGPKIDREKAKAIRQFCHGFGVPEHMIGLKDIPFWRRWWQGKTRRPL